MGPHERPPGGGVRRDGREVPGVGVEHRPYRAGEHWRGHGSATGGCHPARAQELGQSVGGEERDRRDATAPSKRPSGRDADVVGRHDHAHRAQCIAALEAIDRRRERGVGRWSVARGVEIDRHRPLIVCTPRDSLGR